MSFVRKWFKDRGFSVVSITEFGSRSRGENVDDSDYDFSIYVYSSEKIVIPRFIYPEDSWTNLEKNPLFAKLTKRFPKQKLDWSTDYISQMKTDWANISNIKIDGSKLPIDIRWMALNLALETKHSYPFQLYLADVFYGNRFMSNLREIMKSECYFNKPRIQKIFLDSTTESITELLTDSPRDWFSITLDSLIHILSLLSIQNDHDPLWHKNDILYFVKQSYPDFLKFTRSLYETKSSPVKRLMAKSDDSLKIEATRKLFELKGFINPISIPPSNQDIDNTNSFFELTSNISSYL